MQPGSPRPARHQRPVRAGVFVRIASALLPELQAAVPIPARAFAPLAGENSSVVRDRPQQDDCRGPPRRIAAAREPLRSAPAQPPLQSVDASLRLRLLA